MEQLQPLNGPWNFIQPGMGKNLDRVKVGSQEQFANETKSANDVDRLLLKKLTICNRGHNDQQWTQSRGWASARRATSLCIVKSNGELCPRKRGCIGSAGGVAETRLGKPGKVRRCSYPTFDEPCILHLLQRAPQLNDG